MSSSDASVRAFLANHTPIGESESASLHRTLELLSTAENPFSRTSYAPGHLTASGIVVNAQRTHTLLIFHTKLQRWLQPGGHFESGEYDPGAAAAREVFEETGVRTQWPDGNARLLDVDVHAIPARTAEPAHAHFDLRMLLIAEPGEVEAREVTAARWCAPSEFASLNLDPGTLRALKKCGMEHSGSER